MLIKPTKNGRLKITDLSPDDLVGIRNFLFFCQMQRTQLIHEKEILRKFFIAFNEIQRDWYADQQDN